MIHLHKSHFQQHLMATPIPKRASHWWSAFKTKLQIAPRESFDAWEPRTAPPAVSQNSHPDNRNRYLSIFTAAIGVVVALVKIVLELIPHKSSEPVERNYDLEYRDSIPPPYDENQ